MQVHDPCEKCECLSILNVCVLGYYSRVYTIFLEQFSKVRFNYAKKKIREADRCLGRLWHYDMF